MDTSFNKFAADVLAIINAYSPQTMWLITEFTGDISRITHLTRDDISARLGEIITATEVFGGGPADYEFIKENAIEYIVRYYRDGGAGIYRRLHAARLQIAGR